MQERTIRLSINPVNLAVLSVRHQSTRLFCLSVILSRISIAPSLPRTLQYSASEWVGTSQWGQIDDDTSQKSFVKRISLTYTLRKKALNYIILLPVTTTTFFDGTLDTSLGDDDDNISFGYFELPPPSPPQRSYTPSCRQ